MMMTKGIYIGIFLSLVFVSYLNAQQDDFPILKGPYLGQEPPGEMPEVFGPGIISVDENFEHSAAVFSPDGNEVFWCTNVDFYTDRRVVGNLRLHYMKVVDGQWTAPRIAPFAKDIRVERPVFSPDGSRLYFESFTAPDNLDDMDIFVVERKGDGWSEPEKVSSVINTPAIERMHCFTTDGSFYFSRNPFSPREEMFVAKWAGGTFSSPEKLGDEYNADVAEYALVIGPNESYMLTCQQAGHASANVFISYKNADGTWSDRIKTPYYSGGFLALSPDGKYLFIMGEAIYWVSTSFVEELRP